MKSIRANLLLVFAGGIASIVAIGFTLNLFFLEPFYISEKTESLKAKAREFSEVYNENSVLKMKHWLTETENSQGMFVEVFGYNGKSLYSSIDRDRKQSIAAMFQAIDINEKGESSAIDVFLQKLETNEFVVTETSLRVAGDLEFLLVVRKAGNDKLILMRTPIPAITESIDISNRFLLYMGILYIVMGGFVAIFVARSFTYPILTVNQMAKQMTQLNFTQRWTANRRDELGQLGHSMNELSTMLHSSITELNRKNDVLRQELEQKNEYEQQRRLFLSNVSHELKTPIAIIQSYAQGLQLGVAQSAEDQQEYVDIIMDESIKMEQLVYELLELSQLQANKVKLRFEAINPLEIMETTMKLFMPTFQEKEIKIEWHIDTYDQMYATLMHPSQLVTPLPNIRADYLKLQQMLTNYLTNAIRHIDDDKVIRFHIVETKETIALGIYNSGKPIPEEEIQAIWTSFYRLDEARSRAQGNVGLGLSIVAQLAELHDGTAYVTNSPRGVTFWLEFTKIK